MTIKGDPGQVVLISAGPGKNSKITLDESGKATIPVPVEGGQQFTVGDGKWPKATEIVVKVYSSVQGAGS